MNILFSHAPFSNNRFANNLIWMARSFPVLNEIGARFHFPWGKENFSPFLRQDSPWISEASNELCSLFQEASGVELSSESLSAFFSTCEAKTLNCTPETLLRNKSLIAMTEVNGVSVLMARGSGVSFGSLLRQNIQCQLAIIHEPFELTYEGSQFPTSGLDHIHPRESILDSVRAIAPPITPSNNIALHIRRGDYKTWMDGRYYFDDDFWLRTYTSLSRSGGRVYIVSNDYNDPLISKLASLGASVPSGSFAQDFALLMMMDKIYGPPSTFPIMARSLAKSCLDRDILYHMIESSETVL